VAKVSLNGNSVLGKPGLQLVRWEMCSISCREATEL